MAVINLESHIAKNILTINCKDHYQPCSSHKNKGNDHHFNKLLIVQQILPVSTMGNVKKTV